MDLSSDEVQNVFDFLDPKYEGDKLGCSVCGGNEWSARKTINVERESVGPQLGVTYVQLICKNCMQVLCFADRVLAGPWS